MWFQKTLSCSITNNQTMKLFGTRVKWHLVFPHVAIINISRVMMMMMIIISIVIIMIILMIRTRAVYPNGVGFSSSLPESTSSPPSSSLSLPHHLFRFFYKLWSLYAENITIWWWWWYSHDMMVWWWYNHDMMVIWSTFSHHLFLPPHLCIQVILLWWNMTVRKYADDLIICG